MLSKNTLKFIKSLHHKKFRKEEASFFVEGEKSVAELLESDFEVTHLLFTAKFAGEHPKLVERFRGESYEVSAGALETAGTFQSNDTALAVAKMKGNEPFLPASDEWTLALEDIKDPGNLGTIIRIADWYGVKKIVMSHDTADLYNPKVLQSSMGSFTRIKFYYTELADFLAKSSQPVFGAFLEGTSLYRTEFSRSGILLMGNESSGISPILGSMVNHRITIPRVGNAESLNVAVATAIIFDNVTRQISNSVHRP